MKKKISMDPKQIVPEFDEYLHQNGESFDAVVIGAGALSILGVIPRTTQDIDVMDPEISENVKKLSVEFVKELALKGTELDEDWLNNGPISVTQVLPPGWENRLRPLFKGKSITLRTLSRTDFLITKLDALCQRGDDFDDIIRMKPTKEELTKAVEKLKDIDGAEGWEEWLKKQADRVAKALGYAL